MNVQNIIAYLMKNPNVINELKLGNASLIHVDVQTTTAIIQGVEKGHMNAKYIWEY
ncbi:competence pheromone ComX [Bacillus sp. Bos-x628]|uniref:competence pheromone ComX n=1 Tax=Bacillus maqinnsis TaxID=3229854 RepID=UPI00338F886B